MTRRIWKKSDPSYQRLVEAGGPELVQYSVGDMIVYRPSWGSGPPTVAQIVAIDSKNDRVVFDLDNGHWCYQSNVDRKAYD